MISGVTKNIAFAPSGNKNIDPVENFIPNQVDIRNGLVTDAGYFRNRPGYLQYADLLVDLPVPLLAAFGATPFQIAISEDKLIKNVYKLEGATVTDITGAPLTGSVANRPQVIKFDANIIIVDGSEPILYTGSGTTSQLTSVPDDPEDFPNTTFRDFPPMAKYVDTLNNRVILSGYSDTEWCWSFAGNAELYPSANFTNVQGNGEIIMFTKVHKGEIYHFKTNTIEVWVDVGGVSTFARRGIIDKGLGASYSVVFANNTLYWYGNDGDFYVLNGTTPQVISQQIRGRLNDLGSPNKIYGFDCRKEGCIRWFAPIEGQCFVYDYIHKVWSEDNRWGLGHERLPWNSYMEINGEQYFGDYGQTGVIYNWSKDHKTDNGDPMRSYRRFSIKLTEDSTDARVTKLTLRMKRGQ
jgi:hypothetical protein